MHAPPKLLGSSKPNIVRLYHCMLWCSPHRPVSLRAELCLTSSPTSYPWQGGRSSPLDPPLPSPPSARRQFVSQALCNTLFVKIKRSATLVKSFNAQLLYKAEQYTPAPKIFGRKFS